MVGKDNLNPRYHKPMLHWKMAEYILSHRLKSMKGDLRYG